MQCNRMGKTHYNDRSRRLAEFMYLHMIDYDSSKEYDGMKLAVSPA